MSEFYSYLWIREKDGTFPAGIPYYAGKGCNKRAYQRHQRVYPPKDQLNIVIFPMESEESAFESERALIQLFGRVDNGTGCLRNYTDGGEGTTGCILSIETRQKISDALKKRVRNVESYRKSGLAQKGKLLKRLAII